MTREDITKASTANKGVQSEMDAEVQSPQDAKQLLGDMVSGDSIGSRAMYIGSIEKYEIEQLHLRPEIQSRTTTPEQDRDRVKTCLERLLDRQISVWYAVDSPLLPSGLRLSSIAVNLGVIVHGLLVNRKFQPLKKGNGSVIVAGSEEPFFAASLEGFMREADPEARSWVILGAPGSGKTTLLRQVAWRMSRSANKTSEGPLPFLFSLFDLVSAANQQATSVVAFLLTLMHIEPSPEYETALSEIEKNRSFTLLADGLDEVGEHNHEVVENLFKDFFKICKNSTLVMTSRPVGFRSTNPIVLTEIAPLRLEEQRRMLLELCGEELTATILRDFLSQTHLRDLTSNVMLFTILALVVREYPSRLEQVVKTRTELLDTAILILLSGAHRKDRGMRDPERAEKILARASLILHSESSQKEVGIIHSRFSVRRAIEAAQSDWLQPWGGAMAFLDELAEKTGLLFPVDPLKRNYAYFHRTVKEYLAALEISRLQPRDRQRLTASLQELPEWREILIFTAGHLNDHLRYLKSLQKGKDNLAVAALKELREIEQETAREFLRKHLGNIQNRREIFCELVRKMPQEKLNDVLKSYVESAGSDILRVDLYFIEEALNDKWKYGCREWLFSGVRPIPDQIRWSLGEESYWCTIPKGSFEMGAGDEERMRFSWLAEPHKVYLPQFEIARVQVTNKLYEAFDPSHELLREFGDDLSSDELDRNPVVNVSWYESVAFCRWLSTELGPIYLPSEAQWEKAASWSAEGKRTYPWGNRWDPQRLNCWQSGPNRTVPVGSYPNGASYFGALDMLGNVWEWCRDSFPSPKGHPEKTSVEELPQIDSSRKINRGGGWFHDVGQPTVSLSAADKPEDRFSHCGIRLVRELG